MVKLANFTQKEINIWILVSSKAVYVAPGDPEQKNGMFPIIPLKVLSMGELKTPRGSSGGGVQTMYKIPLPPSQSNYSA